jgi:two-component system response regulator HydG
MPKLLFYRRNDELLRVNITGDVLKVGRSADNDVVVPDPTVSRHQFTLEKNGAGWRIKDCSGKGVQINGKTVAEAKLPHKAEFQLAQWRAVFELSPGDPGDETTLKVGVDTAKRKQKLEAQQKQAAVGPVYLHIVSGGVERRLPFVGKMLVGTGEQCAVRLDDPFASWQHATIEQCDFNYFQVADLRSKNGTYLGRARIDSAQIPLDCAIRVGESEITLRRAAGEGKEWSGAIFEGMLSNDAAMHRLWETIDRIASSPLVVAITGESGTGKELVARALHSRSNRASGPFRAINCSSLSKELAESELFGHEKGAFTGADAVHQGAFEATSGGTLFLDEVAEIPLNVQSKLLRVLESNEIRRVGGTSEIKVDVRVVVATNRDLRAEVRHGNFREDLYWRLGMHLALPPLRDRMGDLPLLVRHFLDQGSRPGERLTVTKEAERELLRYSWPGNVRELKNTISRALLARRGSCIELADVDFDPREKSDTGAQKANDRVEADPNVDDSSRVFIVGKHLEDIVNEVFRKTFQRFGSASSVAYALGVVKTTVYRRLEIQGLEPSDVPLTNKTRAAERPAPITRNRRGS